MVGIIQNFTPPSTPQLTTDMTVKIVGFAAADVSLDSKAR